MVDPSSTTGCRPSGRRMGSCCGIQPCKHTKWGPRIRKLVLLTNNVLGWAGAEGAQHRGCRTCIPALRLPRSQEDKSQFAGALMRTGLKLQAAGPCLQGAQAACARHCWEPAGCLAPGPLSGQWLLTYLLLLPPCLQQSSAMSGLAFPLLSK